VHIKKFWQLQIIQRVEKNRPLSCNAMDMGEEKQMIAFPHKQK
jgi:hypothetical protein